MIWQLIKRDAAMKIAPAAVVFALVVFGLPLLPPPSGDSSRVVSAALGGVFFYLGFLVWLGMNAHAHSASYEGALPIAGRDLWLARVVSLLLCIWAPALAAMAGRLPRLPLLAAAFYTALALGVKCFRIRQPGVPQWIRTVMFQVFLLVLTAGSFNPRYFRSARWFVLPPPEIVLAICVPASAALFWWGWRSVPKSFQAAQAAMQEPAEAHTQQTGEPAGLRWPPLLLSVYGGQPMILLIVFTVGYMATGHYGVGLFAGIPQANLRGRCRWLLALPLSPRKLFGLIAVQAAAVTILACVVSMFVQTKHPLSPTERFVEFAAELAVVFFVIFLTELPAWRRLSNLWLRARWNWVRWAPFILSFVAVPAAFSDIGVFQRLAAALPQTWWQLAPLLAVPVIAAYWLAEKAFAEQEYRQLYIETLNVSRGRN